MRLPDTRALGATLVLAGIVALATPAHAQQRTIGPERCSVQLVNQVAPVARDGSWQIDNIPSTTGLTRARLYCNGPYGETRGQSPFVTVLGNRTLGLSSIFPGPMDTGPTRVSVAAQATTLTAMDETIQLETTGLYPDRSMRRIDGASFGTSYASSNPRILEVDANGVVTAKASGTAIVTAWNMGMPGTLVMLVTIGGDSDGDGLPDDYEVLVGLNPNDPLDALADSDADGLTNGEEFTLGSNPFKSDSDGDSLTDGEEARAGQDGFLTNPAAADTDSDLIPDDVEVAVGSDPTDANDTRWDLAMTGLQVRPGALYASLGPLSDGAPRRVTVMAELLGRQLVDVTAHPQTSYYIYYQYIAGLTQTPGEVVPFAQGQTPMDVGFQGYLTQIPIVVSFLVPSPIASVELPAAALDVALDGRIAYLAATTAGLLIMDVLAAPQRMFLGGLDLGARATDVERVGASRVALSLDDGSIALVDVANPRAPALLGKLDLGTTATGLSVSGTLAAVALGADGVALVDLAGPTPTPLGTLAGVNAEQVALRDGLAIVTDRVAVHDGEVHVIDVTDANAPVLRGTVIFDGGPRNVQLVDGGVGYVALYLGGDVNGLGTIDVSDPDHPTILHVGNQGNGFSLRDVAVSGDRLLASDVGQANSLIVLDRSDPRNPLFQLTIQFPGFKNSLGIDASEDLVVATAGNDFFGADDETTLLIGRFRPATTSLGPEPPVGLGGLAPPNTGGGVGGDRVKPVARITAPDNNSVHYRDEPLTVSAWVSDDSGAIVQVDFLVDSNVVATLYQPPYQIELAAGTLDLLPHTFAAQATDPAGNVGRSPTTFVSVIDSPRTRVIGRVLGSDGAPIVGASVEVDGQGLVDGSELDGTFAIDAVRGVDPFMLRVRTSAIAPEETFGPFTPVPDGTTDVGVLGTSATAGERVVGEIVAEPVMVNLTRPDLAGATTFREDFTSAAAVDFRDRTSRASIVTDPGYATAPFIDFYDSGDGSTGDLVVLEGETVTLPQGSLNYADVTVYGTLKFPDGFVYMRIKGDLSGTGEIDTADANALIAVGGQMNMTLDPLNPSKPTGIHGRNEIRIELGIDHPGTSRCDMSIYTEEDESDFNGPVTLELVSNGDFLMDKSAGAFIGGLGPGNSNIARGDTVVHIAGDFSAWQVDAGASATQYQGSGKVDLDVAGDADVDHIFSAGGPARNYGHNSVTVGGDLHAIDIASYDGAGVTVAVGGSATIDHDLSTSDVAGQYASTGALDIAVNGDLSFRDAWTGSYVGSDPSQAADLGDIHVQVGGTLSIGGAIWTGTRPTGAYGQGGDITLLAGRIAYAGGSIRTYDTGAKSGDIRLVADEVVLSNTTLATAGSDVAALGDLSPFRTGAIGIDARLIHLAGAHLSTGATDSGSGDIALRAADTLWIDASSIGTGDTLCPSSGDPYVGSGAVDLEGGASVVLVAGPTEVYPGLVAGNCSATDGAITLQASERVIVAADGPDPIALGYRLNGSSGDPPILREGVALEPPTPPAAPSVFTDRGYGSYGYLTSYPIDSGSDRPEYLAGHVVMRRQPLAGSVSVQWGATDDPVCESDIAWRDDPSQLPRKRYFQYQLSFNGFIGATPEVDALELSYRPHGCDAPGAAACDDHNDCTVDSCDPSGVCQFVDNGDPDCVYDEFSCDSGSSF